MPILWTTSGVNAGGDPFVQLTKNGKIFHQMTAAETREFAMHLFQVAEAAESDAVLCKWASKNLEMLPNQIGAMLVDWRKTRESFGGASWTRKEEFEKGLGKKKFAEKMEEKPELFKG